MSEMLQKGRARLFENLRNEPESEPMAGNPLSGQRIKPATPAQVQAFCEMAAQSLNPRA